MAARVIKFVMRIPVEFVQEDGMVVASCHLLDVHSQGATEDEARDNLAEALQLFLETSYEMGTLEKVLKDSGFRPSHEADEQEDNNRYVDVPFPLTSNNNAEAIAC